MTLYTKQIICSTCDICGETYTNESRIHEGGEFLRLQLRDGWVRMKYWDICPHHNVEVFVDGK